MDCEKFDEHVIDALYGELDELTAAALRRHVESCSRCAAIFANLKSARDVSTLPLEEPPADLEERILTAERAVQRSAPWHKKLMRAAAWAGSHAMRPQLAMAALFMFVIGSSLLLLRAKPGTFAPVSVSERGAPSEAEAAANAPAQRPQSRSAPGAADKGRGEGKADAPAPPAAAAAQAERAEEPADVAAAPAATAAASGAAPKAVAETLKEGSKDAGCEASLPHWREVAAGDGADAEEARKMIAQCERRAPAAAPAPPATATASTPKP
jgi:hypothetical protein